MEKSLHRCFVAEIAAIDARRYDSLFSLFFTQIPSGDYRNKSGTYVEAISNGLLELNRMDAFKNIPGHERHYTPHSEYLFKILQPKLDDTFFLGKNYEAAFDEFEVLFALVIADIEIMKGNTAWGPVGRFGWKHRRDNGPLAVIVNGARTQRESWPPLRAGMFGGDFERFDKVATEYLQVIGRLNWY